MLKSGYFTNRNQIIDWINTTLKLQITKIQQLGSGNIYCHLLDAAYPSKVPLNKVKWNAYLEIDFIYNFKILQNCFQHLGISKHIDVQKLVKAKYQDNLEFIQWIKHHFSQIIKNNRHYDPVARRNNSIVYLLFTDKLVKNKSASNLLNYTTNKENSNIQNYLQTSRSSLKSPRNSFTQLPQRQSLPNERNKQRKTSYIQVISKGDTLIEKPRLNRSNNRVHTESGPLILYQRFYPDFIQEADEQDCF